MRVLFLHQNAPGQFRHLAPCLAADPANEVVFLGERTEAVPGNVRWLRYRGPRGPAGSTHPYLHRLEASVRRGQAAARACLALRDGGFEPDVVVAHAGWGEGLFLREVLPRARVLSYCELFYRGDGGEADYIPETALDLDGRCRLRAWNSDLLVALEAMDHGIAPTEWQRAQHPAAFRPRISVAHEGVDTDEAAPSDRARFRLPDGRVLAPGDEVVTFVARNLEPIRGFCALVRALPALCRRRPDAQVVICGGDEVSYGRRAPDNLTWREALLREVPVDPARVHFVGRLPRAEYLALLQVSALHLYLTAPFVLSWSCVEALAAGCLLLGSNVAPVREVIADEVNGFLVDGRDPDAIAARAAELLSRRAALAPVRRRAREAAIERFELRRCLAAQARIVRSLAA